MQLTPREEPKMKLRFPATLHFRTPAVTPLWALARLAIEMAAAIERIAAVRTDLAVATMLRASSQRIQCYPRKTFKTSLRYRGDARFEMPVVTSSLSRCELS